MLLLPTENELRCIPLDVIIRIEASSNYSKVYLKGQKFPIVAAKILRWFEERLPGQSFARVHRAHLVNKNYMVVINKTNILLETGVTVAVSRRKRKVVLMSMAR